MAKIDISTKKNLLSWKIQPKVIFKNPGCQIKANHCKNIAFMHKIQLIKSFSYSGNNLP